MTLDLETLFRLDVSFLELVVRTSLIYLILLLVLRSIARREMGSLELPELLMIVLIADGVQAGMAGNYESISGALVVAGTLIGWNWLIDWLTYRFAAVERLMRPPPLKLIESGRILRHNMRREYVTSDELWSHLRQEGIEDLAVVKHAFMEPDGTLSVIRVEGSKK